MAEHDLAARVRELEDQVDQLKQYIAGLPARFAAPSPRGTNDSPATIGSAAEGSETADTATFDRADQGTDDGLTITVLTRLVYNHTGDEILYGYFRTFAFDSTGRLVEVSAETRVTIETPEAC